MSDDRQAWFLNEDGTPYPYSVAKQAEDFPNDFHTPYDTEALAEEAAEQLPTQDEEAMALAVADCKREILDDMLTAYTNGDAFMPITVRSFSELHDYVDANTYAGMCGPENPGDVDRSDWTVGDLNALQDAVHEWLASGQAEGEWREKNPYSVCIYCHQLIYFVTGRGLTTWMAVHPIGRPPLNDPEPHMCPGETVQRVMPGGLSVARAEHPHQPRWLTLGEFRALTEHLPDNMPVTAYSPPRAPRAFPTDEGHGLNDWLNLRMPDPENIPGANWPEGDDPPSLILETHDDFDTRQW